MEQTSSLAPPDMELIRGARGLMGDAILPTEVSCVILAQSGVADVFRDATFPNGEELGNIAKLQFTPEQLCGIIDIIGKHITHYRDDGGVGFIPLIDNLFIWKRHMEKIYRDAGRATGDTRFADLPDPILHTSGGGAIIMRENLIPHMNAGIAGMKADDKGFFWGVAIESVCFFKENQIIKQFKEFKKVPHLKALPDNSKHYKINGVDLYTIVVNSDDNEASNPFCPLHFTQGCMVNGFEYWFKNSALRDKCAAILEPRVRVPVPPIPEDRSDYLPVVPPFTTGRRNKRKRRRKSRNGRHK